MRRISTYSMGLATRAWLMFASSHSDSSRRSRVVSEKRRRQWAPVAAMANDREITATLGVPVRRVEAAAWFGCGVVAGIAGILLADLVALDATTLTFLVISSLAAALIARLDDISRKLDLLTANRGLAS